MQGQVQRRAVDTAQQKEIKRIKAGLGLMLEYITLPESPYANAARNAYVKQEINNLMGRAKYYFNNKSSKEYMQLCITTLQKLKDQIPALPISDKHNKLHKLISRFDAIAEREARIAGIVAELSDVPGSEDCAKLEKLKKHIANMQGEGFLRYVGTEIADAYKLENAAWFTYLSEPEQSYFKKIREELNTAADNVITKDTAIHYLRAIQAFDSSYTCTIMPSNLYIEDAKSAGYFAGAFGAVSEANTAAMPVARIGLISNGGDDVTARSKVRQLLLTYATNLFAAKYKDGAAKTNLHISFSSYLDALNLPGFPSDAKYEKLVAEITKDPDFITKLTASCKNIKDIDKDLTVNLTYSFNRYPINATREYMTPANRIKYQQANISFAEYYRGQLKENKDIDTDIDKKTYIEELLKAYEQLNNNIYSSGKGFVAWCGALQGEGKHNKQAALAVLHQLIVDQFNDGSVRNCKSSKDRTGLVAILLERAKQWKKLYPKAGLPKFIQEACGTWSAQKEATYNLVPPEKQQDSYPPTESELIAQAETDIGDKVELNKIYDSAKECLSPKDVDALITCVEYKKQTSTTGHALKDSPNTFAKSKGLAVGAMLAGTIGFGVTAAVFGGLTSVNAVERLWHTNNSTKQSFWDKGFGKFLATVAKVVATPFVAVAGFVAGATVGIGSVVVSAAKSLVKPTTYQTTPDMQAHLSDPEFSKINSHKTNSADESKQPTNFKELTHDSKRCKHKGKQGLLANIFSAGSRAATKKQNIAGAGQAMTDADALAASSTSAAVEFTNIVTSVHQAPDSGSGDEQSLSNNASPSSSNSTSRSSSPSHFASGDVARNRDNSCGSITGVVQVPTLEQRGNASLVSRSGLFSQDTPGASVNESHCLTATI
jgi:hypothetical protein